MARWQTKSLRLVPVLLLITLPAYRSGPFSDGIKAEEKKGDAKEPARLDVNAVPERT